MVTAREGHTATLLPSGKVLVAGGWFPLGTSLRSAELYNPATGTWTLIRSMRGARAFHTATLLLSGKVLVAAGVNGAALTSAELYRSGHREVDDDRPPGHGTFSIYGDAAAFGPGAGSWRTG